MGTSWAPVGINGISEGAWDLESSCQHFGSSGFMPPVYRFVCVYSTSTEVTDAGATRPTLFWVLEI